MPTQRGDAYSAIDGWYNFVMGNPHITEDDIFTLLRNEHPKFISVVFERWCSLQCRHCFYQPEQPTADRSDTYGLGPILNNLVSQIRGEGPCQLLHAGRVLRAWHISTLKRIREKVPKLEVGLIDSGAYTNLLSEFRQSDLTLDWLDISLDGPEGVHDHQRNHRGAFQIALNGLAQARRVVPKGKVSALFTLTNLNSDSVVQTADIALAYVDEFHISPISPRAGQEGLTTSAQQFAVAWGGCVKATKKYGRDRVRVRLYGTRDMAHLENTVGREDLARSLCRALVTPQSAEVSMNLKGVSFSFFPTSLWPREEVIVDADGAYRMGYGGQFTLREYEEGLAHDGTDIRQYTVAKLGPRSNLEELYAHCVEQWWAFLGRKKLQDELATFRSLLQGR